MPSWSSVLLFLPLGAVLATPMPQAVDYNICFFNQTDPATWAFSGADALLAEQLEKFGPGKHYNNR